MKSNKKILIVFLIIILDSSLFYSQLSGSTLGKIENGYTIGLNYGDARQLSDIPATSGGWETSLYLGKNLYYNTDATFSFDLLGNLSFSVSKGLDPDAKFSPFENSILNNTDYNFFYNNNKTSLFTIGIDGKLSYNKFRSQQNWYLAMILGGNWGIFTANMDLKDESGNYYIDEFEKIKNDSYKDKKSKLKKILDRKYETKAESFDDFSLKSRLMPSIGLEVGFDVTDYLSFYIADRFTFTNTNTIDGEINLDGSKDFLNFAHIGFNLYFGNNSKSSYIKSTPTTSEVEPISGYKIPKEVDDHNYPEVKIIIPDSRPYNSENRDLLVKAKITNVNSVLDIYCKVNGEKVDFDYSSNFVQFVAQLEPGDNKIQIYAKNDYGQSRDVLSVYFNGGRQELSEPEIRLISPKESVSYSEEDIFTIKAYINFVKSKEDVKILANGQPFKSYKFNPETNEFKIKIRLASGQNSFEIIAENKEGKAINSFDIYYDTKPPENKSSSSQTPTITILNPTSPNTNINDTDLLDFKAKIENVTNKNDITFNVNGNKNRFFDYDPKSGILEDKISLFDEVTKIEIKVKNDFGSASKEITVRFGEEIESKPTNPIEFINVTSPDSDCKVDITVKIDDANRKNDLQLFLNQFQIRNFLFNKSSKILKSTLYLDEGQNTIKVIFNSDEEIINTYDILCDLNGNYENDNSSGENDNDDYNTINEKPIILIDYPQNGAVVENENITLKATLNYIESKNDISISLNDQNISNFNFDSETGEIFSDLLLKTGENVIEIEANNTIGKIQKRFSITYEEPLKGPPSVLINSPRNGFKTDEQTAVFRASIENIKNTENIYVTLNDNTFSDFNFDLERGIIFGHLPLILGKNTLTVEAKNRLGSDIDEVIFNHRMDVVPAVKILSPKKGIVMGVAYTPLEAITQNIKNKIEAVIIINGKYYKSFKLNNEKVTSRIPLRNGENEIIVKAVNDYGEDSDTTMVIFNGKPEKPTITILKPDKSNKTVNSKTFEFEAKVIGIKHSSFVDLNLNNRSINDVYYYKQDKLVKATLELRKGWNYITLNATNEAGVESKKIKIFLE